MIWLTKKFWEKVLIIAIFVFSFISGILFNSNIILSILCLIVAIGSQVIREKLQSNIRGDGIRMMTVGNKEPTDPAEGDLWVDTTNGK